MAWSEAVVWFTCFQKHHEYIAGTCIRILFIEGLIASDCSPDYNLNSPWMHTLLFVGLSGRNQPYMVTYLMAQSVMSRASHYA